MIKIKNIKTKSIIVLIITVIVLSIVLKDEFFIIVDTLKTCNPLWIIAGLIIMTFLMLFRGLGLYRVARGYDIKLSIWEAFIMEIKTSFFNGITPFSTGGQPFQIYAFKKKGISIAKGASVELVNFVTYQLALVIIGFIVLIINSKYKIINNMGRFLAIGFFVNTVIMLGLLFISYARKTTKKICIFFINLLSKLKVIKDKERILDNIDDRLGEFHKATNFYKNKKKDFLLSFLYHFMELACLYTIPLFAFYAVNTTSVSFIECFSATAYTMVIGSFVPIPGGSGGMEYVYTRLFSNFASSSIVSTTLIIWRSISYYIPMLIGGILFNLKESD